MAHSKASFKVNQEDLTSFLERVGDDIIIPAHQREFCWTLLRMQELVETVMTGLPIPTLILFQQRPHHTLEDGQQRITTLRRFRENQFPLKDGRFYKDFTAREQADFDKYPVPVLTYKNATRQQVIEIFNRFQNGSALTVGERLHALSELSPLVRYTRTQLLTAGSGLHDRASAVWGNRSGADPRRRNLLNACALVAGLAFGSGHISRKQADFEKRDGEGVMLLARDFDEALVTRKLSQILSIYEQVDARHHVGGKRQMNFHWNLGNMTGYIAHSLNCMSEAEWVTIAGRWIEFLVATRTTPAMLSMLNGAVSAARFWSAIRWQTGCHIVMPDLFMSVNNVVADDEEEESDDGSDEL